MGEAQERCGATAMGVRLRDAEAAPELQRTGVGFIWLCSLAAAGWMRQHGWDVRLGCRVVVTTVTCLEHGLGYTRDDGKTQEDERTQMSPCVMY